MVPPSNYSRVGVGNDPSQTLWTQEICVLAQNIPSPLFDFADSPAFSI